MQILARETVSVPAGATVTVFANKQINQFPFSGYYELGLNATAGLTVNVVVAGTSMQQGDPIKVGTTYPVLPDELDIVNEQVSHSTLATIQITNPTAGALSYWAYARLASIPRG